MKDRTSSFVLGITLIGALLCALFYVYMQSIPRPAPDTTPKVSASTELPTERVRNGERVFKKLGSGVKDFKPMLRGFGAPSVALVVPLKAWSKLSKSDQVDVTYFAQSLVARVRESPYEYVDMPSTAPVYKSAVEYAKNICSDCWEIITGNPTKTGVLTVDAIAVQGDSCWERGEPETRGEKASAFRVP